MHCVFAPLRSNVSTSPNYHFEDDTKKKVVTWMAMDNVNVVLSQWKHNTEHSNNNENIERQLLASFFLLNLITDNARSFWFFILFFRVILKSKTIAFTNQPMAMTIINLNLFTQQMPIACLFCDFSFLNINSLVCECVCMFYFLSACVSILLWISFANHITSHHFFCTRAYAQLFLA